MVIGIDIRHLCEEYPSGVGIYTRQILHALAAGESEHHFHLVSAGMHAPKLPREITDCQHITHEHVRMPSKLFSLFMKLKLRTLESYSGLPIKAWWLPNINFTHTELPYAITVHDMSYRLRPSWYSPKSRAWHRLLAPKQLISGASRVIVPSKATQQDLIAFDWAELSSIRIAPHGAPSEPGREQPHDRHTLKTLGVKGDYFLSIGTVEPRKNLAAAIQAFERYKSSGGEKKLVIAGKPGYRYRAIARRVKQSPYGHFIHLLSYVSEGEKWSLLRKASGLVFPSLYEGYGMPLLEALVSHTPVLTSAHSSLLEFDSPNILYADPFSTSDLAEGMKLLERHKFEPEKRALPTWQQAAELTAKAAASVLQ